MMDFFKKIFILFLATFFPWLLLLLDDNPGGAIISLVMQVTIIGWPFATVWAWNTHYGDEKYKKNKKDKKIKR